MAGYTKPIAAGTGGLAFTRFASEDIRRVSVKQIHVAPALDSMLGPIPGGVHDLALGAIQALDANCTTCRMNAFHCAGHCGHIELPVPCYHPQYMDTTLRLLRSKCAYCHRFKANENYRNRTVCSLQLLQYGLIEDYQRIQSMTPKVKRAQKTSSQGDDIVQAIEDAQDAQEALDHLIHRRTKETAKAVKKAQKAAQAGRTPLAQNPTAVAARKAVITEFLKELPNIRKCMNCGGASTSYRKDRNVKIFKKPLAIKQKEAMHIMGMQAPNPLIFLQAERAQKDEVKKQAPMVNGGGGHADDSDTEMADPDREDSPDSHGAEEEIALRNALETAAASKNAQAGGDDEDVQQYMTPSEVQAALTLLFEREQEVLSLMYSSRRPGRSNAPVSADMFFMTAVLVPPNRYRPLARQGPGQVMEAQANSVLNKVIQASNDVRRILREMKRAKTDSSVRPRTLNESIAASITLQEAVNAMIDSPPPASGRPTDQGIKQVLEKKEGLFRMHMMGKRVNFAARSVISPDPNIETSEIGVPLVFAKKLTYPEPVTSHNFEAMSQAVINGMDKYPGAAAIENENGQVMSLKRKTPEQRQALAKQLMTTTVAGASKGENCKKVYRHLVSGDVVIMNRQPTLHKPSMMGHIARVLNNQKTIRMHYANCNTYNADFDGDEMNMHFPQNEHARTEAMQIANTDNQYLSATAGKPLRGLIQDHISMGVQFTSRDIFFDRDQYQQLLYCCLRPESNQTVFEKIEMVQPAILKPKMLWTGKQVITTVLKNITPDQYTGLNLTSKSSTSSEQWGELTNSKPETWTVTRDRIVFRDTEQVVIIKDGELLCGILDKSQLGPSAGGLIHSIYELYGAKAAGLLLSIMGRLLTRFLNERAWTCGMDDLYLTPEGDRKRRNELNTASKLGLEVSSEYVSLKSTKDQSDPELLHRLENVLRNDDQLNGLDQLYKAKTKSITDNVSKHCLPAGLRKPFPRNQMQAMTLSGAKGSSVNANLISCNLGQQVLEGRRVPTMVSGKTLPSFRAFETHPVAGGYVSGRFLTGIKPQEYFFHAMSGREGLIDTAVKTAKSGYLQRCIVKGLEGLRTEYDTSVRETSNGNVIQFLYGEDGLEVIKQKHLQEFKFLAENYVSVAKSMDMEQNFEKIPNLGLGDQQKHILKGLRKGIAADPVTTWHPPATNFGSTSELFAKAVTKYTKDNPDKLLRDKKAKIEGLSSKDFRSLLDLKYMRSVVEAGEAVGVVAAQSVGEPSTQMTLNTFHLAGHSAKNVTLGIPRLREIVMTASAKIMTPTMTMKPIEELPREEGERFAKGISRLSLAQVIDELSVTERAGGGSGHEHERLYDISVKLYDPEEYEEEYAIQSEDVRRAFETKFLPRLDKLIKAEFKKKAKESSMSEATAAVPEIGASVGVAEEARPERARMTDREGGEEDIDEEADEDDAKDMAARRRREDTFDEPDDEERQIADEDGDEEMDSDVEEVNGSATPSNTKNKSNGPRSLQEQDPEDSDGESERDTEDEARDNQLKQNLPHLKRFSFTRNKGRSCRIVLSYSSNTPKLLLLPILEKCAHWAVIQSIPGLGVCMQSMEEVLGSNGKPKSVLNPATGLDETLKEPVITTEGVNLLAMRDYQHFINPHTLYSNSVVDMLKLYGVEAARATIIKEIDTVFKGHGIAVDNRHLNLIADAMTQSGSYMPFSRHGIVKEGGSVLAKMSFETVMGFLKDAVLFGESDPLLGPSARIVAGRRGNIGTGSFDVVMPVH